MNKLKALIVTLVVGTSSVAMAAPRIIASRDATFVRQDRRPVYQPPVYQRPVYHQPVHQPPVYQPDFDDHCDTFSISGSYSSAYGPVQLFQHGDRVTGTFTAGGGGTIEGRIVGDQIFFTWKNTAERGRGVWMISSSNRIDGTWGTNRSETDGGAWTLKRV